MPARGFLLDLPVALVPLHIETLSNGMDHVGIVDRVLRANRQWCNCCVRSTGQNDLREKTTMEGRGVEKGGELRIVNVIALPHL